MMLSAEEVIQEALRLRKDEEQQGAWTAWEEMAQEYLRQTPLRPMIGVVDD
jgi:hypothetical protein